MIIKSFILEKKISLVDEYFVVLFYGENIGMKDEIKDQIKKHYKNSEKIVFHQDEIIKNDKLLNEHIHNRSLFAENKIIIYDKGIDRMAILGEHMDFDDQNNFILSYRSGNETVPTIKWIEPIKLEIEHFLDCIVNGAQCMADALHAEKVVNILNMK